MALVNLIIRILLKLPQRRYKVSQASVSMPTILTPVNSQTDYCQTNDSFSWQVAQLPEKTTLPRAAHGTNRPKLTTNYFLGHKLFFFCKFKNKVSSLDFESQPMNQWRDTQGHVVQISRQTSNLFLLKMHIKKGNFGQFSMVSFLFQVPGLPGPVINPSFGYSEAQF